MPRDLVLASDTHRETLVHKRSWMSDPNVRSGGVFPIIVACMPELTCPLHVCGNKFNTRQAHVRALPAGPILLRGPPQSCCAAAMRGSIGC